MLQSTARFSAILVALLAPLAAADPPAPTWSIVPLTCDKSLEPLAADLRDKLKQRIGTRLGTREERAQEWRALPEYAHLDECDEPVCLGGKAKEVHVDRVLRLDPYRMPGDKICVDVKIVDKASTSLASQTMLIKKDDPHAQKLDELVEQVDKELSKNLPPEPPTPVAQDEPKTREVPPPSRTIQDVRSRAALASPIMAPGHEQAPSDGAAALAKGASAAPSGSRNHTVAWVVTGASAVALVSGGVFGMRTLSSRSPDDAFKANVLYGIGGGLALTSAALFYFQFQL